MSRRFNCGGIVTPATTREELRDRGWSEEAIDEVMDMREYLEAKEAGEWGSSTSRRYRRSAGARWRMDKQGRSSRKGSHAATGQRRTASHGPNRSPCRCRVGNPACAPRTQPRPGAHYMVWPPFARADNSLGRSRGGA